MRRKPTRFSTPSTQLRPTKNDFTKLREKFGKIEYGHGSRTVSEIYSVKKPGDEPAKVVADTRYIREFAVTKDGKKIAMVSAFDDSVQKSEGESRVDVREDGKVTTPADGRLPREGREVRTRGSIISRGRRMVAASLSAVFTTPIRQKSLSVEWKEEKWAMKRLSWEQPGQPDDTIHVHGYGSPLMWLDNFMIAFLGDVKGRTRVLLAYPEVGGFEARLPRMGTTPSISCDQIQHFFVYVGDTAGANEPTGKFPCLHTESQNREHNRTRRSQSTHEGLEASQRQAHHLESTGRRERRWTTGTPFTAGRKATSRCRWSSRFTADPPPLATTTSASTRTTAGSTSLPPGTHVLCPNYRGSTGYGDKFVTDLIGNENDIEVKDIIAGIQHLIKEGIADPERIAVMGWGNGGYLTNCPITLKDPPVKIKAASSGAGILDTVAEWGFNDEPAYPIVFKKGPPWEQPDIYKKTSPTYGIGNVTTPTLIHVGGGDERCLPGHSKMLYRALKEYQKVPTQLNVYPGQPHGLGTLSFRTAKMEWDLAWFEKYLKK